jgi:hypothetical protein
MPPLGVCASLRGDRACAVYTIRNAVSAGGVTPQRRIRRHALLFDLLNHVANQSVVNGERRRYPRRRAPTVWPPSKRSMSGETDLLCIGRDRESLRRVMDDWRNRSGAALINAHQVSPAAVLPTRGAEATCRTLPDRLTIICPCLAVPWSKTPHQRRREVIALEGASSAAVLPIRADSRVSSSPQSRGPVLD